MDTALHLLGMAEIHDPATDVWTVTGSLETVHAQRTATLLPNGKMLVTRREGAHPQHRALHSVDRHFDLRQ